MSLPKFFYAPIKTNPNPKSFLIKNQVSEIGLSMEELKKKRSEEKQLTASKQQAGYITYNFTNNLLGAAIKVKSFTKLVVSRLDGKLDVENKQLLELIYQSSAEMYQLIENLQEYFGLDMQEIQFSEFCCKELVEEIIDRYEKVIKTNNVALTVAENLPKVHADREKLERVFENLINNAIKFSDKKKNAYVSLLCSEDNEVWKFMVMDNGIGIPNTRTNIFEINTRLNGKNKYKGSGMGLSFCRLIVEMHGGEISYQSEEKKGTIFMFTIPKTVQKFNEIPQYVKENSISR